MSIQQLVEDTYDFNAIAGNDKKFSKQSFLEQLAVLEEEVRETREAIEAGDIVEIADGAIDVIVVAAGLVQKLESMGVNMSYALKLIGHNNLEKYPSIHDDSIVDKTLYMYSDKGINAQASVSIEGHCYVFKNAVTGKILKPYGFKAVDLVDCVPEGLKLQD